MTDLLKLFDSYSRRARIYPALISIAPLVALLVKTSSSDGWTLENAFVMLGVAIAYFVLGLLARRTGKRLEADFFTKWGGKPSVLVLRHDNSLVDSVSKGRYHKFLAGALGVPAPTPETEQHNSSAANQFYESAGNRLRELTRSRSDFPLVFEENVSYGFWRNLRGLKPFALVLDFLVSAIVVWQLWKLDEAGQPVEALVPWLVVIGVCVLHGILFLLGATDKAVKAAAFEYARQLVLSCERLISPV
jgi:hypothetical protein